MASVWDHVFEWTLKGTVAALLCLSIWFLSPILLNGVSALEVDFLTNSIEAAGRKGGIGPILVSTGLILFVCMLTAFPLGVLAAFFLVECSRKNHTLYRPMTISLDVLAATPSIVFGLFGNALFCHRLGLGFSILSGGLTLACMVLPLIIRFTEEGIKAIPLSIWSAAGALGLTRWTMSIKLAVPLAFPALLMGFALGLGRAIAETAALIFTSGYVPRMPESLLDSGRSLSIHIYDLTMNVPGGNTNAYRTAFVLLTSIVMMNLLVNGFATRMRRRFRLDSR